MYAVGSSYLIRQSPGGERLGGVRIRLSRATGTGVIEVKLTSWFGGAEINEDIADLVEAAIQGVRDCAQQYGVDLSDYHILLSEFAFHLVDSRPNVFYQTARSAFRSALGAWLMRDLEPGG